jgi:ribosomal protein S18 acetylase RimI-like enzyme
MIIRRVEPADMDRWFEMRIQSLKEVPDAFLASPEAELAQGLEFFRARVANGANENAIFAAFDGDTLAGSVGLVRDSHKKASHKAIIWGMYVKPEYRSRKLGARLLQTAIEFAKYPMGVEQIVLSVVTTRKEAKALYTKLGFQHWGTEPNAVRIADQVFDEDYMTLFLK